MVWSSTIVLISTWFVCVITNVSDLERNKGMDFVQNKMRVLQENKTKTNLAYENEPVKCVLLGK